MNRTINGSLSPSAVREIVKRYAREIGVPELAPHDMRRSYARLSRDGGAPLEVIQKSLGHASVQTTERYISTTASGNAGEYIKI